MLLRLAISGPLLVEGAGHLRLWETLHAVAQVLSVSLLLAGCLLMLGAFTPVVSALVGTGALLFVSSTVFSGTSPMPVILFVPLAGAVALLGPGAVSVDARLFGRRQIIIPRSRTLPRT